MRKVVASAAALLLASGWVAQAATSVAYPALTVTGSAAPADTMTVSDASGAGETNYPLQFGRPFAVGAIPGTPTILINGVAATSQADVKNRYPDGSVKFAVMAVVIPSIPANGFDVLTFANTTTPNNTPLTVAQMQAPAYNFDAHINLTIPPRIAGKPTGTPACAAWAAITNGEFVEGSTTVGPINFSNIASVCSSNGNPAAFPLIAADINAALPPGMFLTQSLNQGSRYFQLTGTAGTASLAFVTAPSGGTDISGMLNLTAAGALDYNLGASAPSASAAAMLAAAGSCSAYTSAPALCKLWTSGPVAQTIILRDDSAAAAYDIGNGDGQKPFRPGFQATFWPALNQVFVRAIGDNDNIAELEDLDYGVKITLGATSPTNLYTADLSGTGEIYGEGITGLSINQTVGWQFQGAVAIAGTPSSPLVANQIYSAIDPKTDEWFAFKYLSPTSVLVQARGEMADGGFGNSANALTAGDPIVITSPTVDWAQTRWTRTGWIGAAPNPEVNIDPNLAYLEYTRFVPNYDPNLVLAPTAIAASYAGLWAQYPNNFFDGTWDDGSEIFSYMENPGARPDIGPEPQWVALDLESHGDWRMRRVDLGLADLYGEETFDLRESVAGKRLLRSDAPGASTGLGHAMSITDRKTITTGFYNGAAADNPVVTGIIDTVLPISTSGPSHQPDPFFWPYVSSGDPFYLDQMYLWNAWNSGNVGSAIPKHPDPRLRLAVLFLHCRRADDRLGASQPRRGGVHRAGRGRGEDLFHLPDERRDRLFRGQPRDHGRRQLQQHAALPRGQNHRRYSSRRRRPERRHPAAARQLEQCRLQPRRWDGVRRLDHRKHGRGVRLGRRRGRLVRQPIHDLLPRI